MSTNTIPAIFQGLDLFGAPGSFTNQSLSNAYGALPSHVDEFLGLTPGTTKYGADPAPGAGLWGITGAFTSTVSSAAATAQQTALLAWAGISGAYGFPTGLPWPGNFELRPNCYFVAAEYVPAVGGPVENSGGVWTLTYRVVMRDGGIG